MPKDLQDFVKSNPDPRELKRGIAVQMFLTGYKHREIEDSIGVSSGFISKWAKIYKEEGISGLKLRYQGSVGYLKPEQKQSVLTWLKGKNYWSLIELKEHIEQEYDVVFRSNQSYYALFKEAGLSWKKTQKQNPKADPELTEEKKRRL